MSHPLDGVVPQASAGFREPGGSIDSVNIRDVGMRG